MTGVALSPPVPQRVKRRSGSEYLVAAICVAVMLVMLWPLAMSFLASVKPPPEAASPPPHYLPQALSLDSYRMVATYNKGLWVYTANSLSVAAMTIAMCLALAVPAGYGLARFPVPGKDLWFLLLLASMMVPYQALLVPLYLMFAKLGLTASLFGLAVLHTILQLPFSIYLMRNAFEAVPREMDEAARVDGASSLFTLRRVFLPLVMPGMVTVALFAFVTSWNEFLGALILMNSEDSFTVPIMLTGVVSGDFGSVNWGGLQASVIVSMLPCLLIYVLLQKYYVSGFLSGAVK